MSDLGRRVGTALVLVPFVLALVALGGWPFAAFLVLGAVLTQAEVYNLANAGGFKPYMPLGLAAGALVVLAPMWEGALPLATLAVLALFVAELYRRHERPLENVATAVFGVVYPGALVAWILYLRIGAAETVGQAGAAWLTIAALTAVWGADSFAYFAGRAFGRRPLFPRISPKKTVEGLVGGALGAVALMIGFKLLVLPFLSWVDVVVIGLLAGGLGPFGDLAASMFKRSVGVKDSGKLLPGHGGVLDRVDAALFVVPVITIYLAYVARLF